MASLPDFLSLTNLRKFIDDMWIPQTKDDDIAKYTVHSGRIIGYGISGRVYKVENTETGENVAAKVMDIRHQSIDLILREIKLQSILSKYPNCNKNIVCLYEVYRDDRYIIIISEFVEGMELYDVMLRHFRNTKNIPIDVVMSIMKDTLTGLKYMHNHGIAHKDIKFENIMFDKNKNVYKYIDLGLGCLFAADEKSICNYASGTPYYVSPETYWNSTRKDVTFDDVKRQDIWSLGVVLFLLLNGGDVPVVVFDYDNSLNLRATARDMFNFYGEDESPVDVQQSKYKGSKDESLNTLINEFVMSMIVVKPDDRPSIDYLYDHFVNHIKGG